MISLSARARSQLDELTEYYAARGRDRAIENLAAAIEGASARISSGRGPFLDAPRAYPGLRRPGVNWLKEQSYWIAFTQAPIGPAIIAIYHESADIPRRY